MLVAVCSVVYISRVLCTYVLDYNLFVQHNMFTSNTCKLIQPTAFMLVCIAVYFWFSKIIYGVGIWSRVYRASYYNVLMTNEMHNSYN